MRWSTGPSNWCSGFAVLVWLALVVILLMSPHIYTRSLGVAGPRQWVELGFLVMVTGLLALLGLAVVRRWGSAFWLILVAFFAGLLRVPVAGAGAHGSLLQRRSPLVCRRPGRGRGHPVPDRDRDARRVSEVGRPGDFLAIV